MKILSIETSCDETGISVLSQGNGNGKIALLGNALASQIELHAQYGGVFPAMAKRAHAEKIVPLIKAAFAEAQLLSPRGSSVGTDNFETIKNICTHEDEMVNNFVGFFNTYEKPDVDYIAVTVGPGLEPALWVGINAAKVLSTVWDIPVIPVNHMEGHVVTAAVQEQETSHQSHSEGPRSSLAMPTPDLQNGHAAASQAAEAQKQYQFRNLQFPLLALLVSGGHTELVLTESYDNYKKIGQTRDDAVGEAFDKVARMLGLPYPGGPAVSKLAREFRSSGKVQPFEMPRPMLHSGDYDFSFSGIKTAMLYAIRALTAVASAEGVSTTNRGLTDDEKPALAAAFEDAVVEVIIKKTLRAAEEFHIQTIVVGGGVAGNTFLREKLTEAVAHLATRSPSVQVLFPEPWLATDNAIMIGLAAFARFGAQKLDSSEGGLKHGFYTQDPLTLKANGNLSIQTK